MRPPRHPATGPLAGTLLAVALLAGASACGASPTAAPPAAATAPAFHGVEPSPVPSRPAFTLTDTTGARYDFAARTAGHPTYVYYGYTHCPDECPTAMADLATVLRTAPAALAAQTRVVFVTTDPTRDTAPVLRRWLDRFSPAIVGLLGTQVDVDAAQTAAGVPAAHVEGPSRTPGAAGYSVAHSSVIFAYDAADRLPVVYPGGVTPSEIAADLPALAHPAGSTK